MGLLHEIFHLLVERYEDEAAKGTLEGAADDLEARLRADARKVLRGFATEFPTDGKPELPPEVVEELLLTRVANENPAAMPIRDLFDDRPLATATPYEKAIAALEASLAGGPGFGPEGETLVRAPARARAPRSRLAVRPAALHPGALARPARRCARSADGRARPDARGPGRRGAGAPAPRGSLGRSAPAPAHAPSFAGAEQEPERFSSDSAWMPRVVLMAKSTYVWLDQLSRVVRPRHPDARRDPRRGARHARALGRHRAVADRPLGALAGLREDQALARQRRRGRVGVLARRLPDRRRPRWRGRLRGPARPGVGARHPARERHGPEPHGHRLALGRRAPGLVPVAPGAAVPGLLLHRRRPVRRRAGRDRARGPLLERLRRGGRRSSASTGRPAKRATSTTATTARASRGTTPRSSTTSSRRSARRSSRRSSRSPGASR